MMCPKLLI
uniref:Uncharacterized protein n=1 Tax=Arundo donax TaxID=35708 RepID=A0A0A8YYA8_ARUDO